MMCWKVHWFCCLGDVTAENDKCLDGTRASIPCVQKKSWISPFAIIGVFHIILRVHTYEACIRIVLLYIFEMWSGKEEEVMHTLKNENAISWRMCCRKCFLPSMIQLCSILYLCNIGNIFRCNRLKWCGHIFCMEENQWPEQTIKFHVEGLLPRKKAF